MSYQPQTPDFNKVYARVKVKAFLSALNPKIKDSDYLPKVPNISMDPQGPFSPEAKTNSVLIITNKSTCASVQGIDGVSTSAEPQNRTLCKMQLSKISLNGIPKELQKFDQELIRYKQIRQERYDLQAHASKIIPEHRVSKCQYRIANANESIAIKKVNLKAFYSNLQVCGSVWDCPVCSSKVSEKRREQILKVVNLHRSANGVLLMATLTFPHTKADDLKELMQIKLKKAIEQLTQGAQWVKFCEKFNLVGTIRALEVTHGQKNGWHPHYHILMLFSPIDMSDIFIPPTSSIVPSYSEVPRLTELLAKGYSKSAAKKIILRKKELNIELRSRPKHVQFVPDFWKPFVEDIAYNQHVPLEIAAQIAAGDEKVCNQVEVARMEYFMGQVRLSLLDKWTKACLKAGLPEPNHVYGVDIQNGDAAQDYIAKYGMEPSSETLQKIEAAHNWDTSRELVSSNSKRGGATHSDGTPKGLTPFDLLRISANLYEHKEYSQKQASALFREFSFAFFRKKQLTWSKGLKDLFNIDDTIQGDEALAESESEESELICQIPLDEWKSMLYVVGRGGRQVLLEVAETYGSAGVNEYLKQVMEKLPYSEGETVSPKVSKHWFNKTLDIFKNN